MSTININIGFHSEHKGYAEEQVWALAEFVKRIGWQEIRSNAKDEDEAHAICAAIIAVQTALEDAGYKPR